MSASTAAARPTRSMATRTAAPPRRLSGYALGVGVLTGVGLVFRIAFLGRLPYWRDEAFTAVATRSSWTAMFDTVRHDSAPPLGYILGHLASSISTAPIPLRMVSALAGTAAVPLTAALARRAGGDRAGIWGAAVAAVMPTLVITSRDVRMYSLAITLVLLAALTLVRALERPDRGRLAVHAVVVALAVHTHYLAVLAIVVQLLGAAVLHPSWRSWRRCVLATAAGGLTLVPWLIAAQAQFQHTGFWLPVVSGPLVEDVTTEFFRGPRLADDITLGWLVQAAAVAAGTAGFLGMIVGARRLGRDAGRHAAFLLVSGLGATLILLAVSTRRPYFDGRYASVVWAPLLPLLGAGVARLRPRVVGGAVVVGVLALCTATVLVTTQRPDWQVIAAWLDARVGPRDELVLNSPDYLLIVQYADPATVAHTRVLNRTGPPWYWGTAAYPPGAVVRTLTAEPDTYDIVGYLTEFPVPPGYRPVEPPECVEGFCITPLVR